MNVAYVMEMEFQMENVIAMGMLLMHVECVMGMEYLMV